MQPTTGASTRRWRSRANAAASIDPRIDERDDQPQAGSGELLRDSAATRRPSTPRPITFREITAVLYIV